MPRLPLLLAVLAVSAGPAWALPASKPASAVVTEQQAILPADGPYVVKLSNLRGPVLIRGWNKNVVYVKAEKRATHALSGTEASLYKDAKVTVDRPDPATVAIATRFPMPETITPGVAASRLPHVEVAYTLAVPPGVAVQLDQEAGDVRVVGTDGRLRLFTRDGSLLVANASGRVEAGNERGDLHLTGIDGDVAANTLHGQIYVSDVSGDLQAKTSTGNVWVTVSPRFSADISFHTVRGDFRSDLSTFNTDMGADEAGYVGMVRGPLAMSGAPDIRYQVDTVSGTLQIANERAVSR